MVKHETRPAESSRRLLRKEACSKKNRRKIFSPNPFPRRGENFPRQWKKVDCRMFSKQIRVRSFDSVGRMNFRKTLHVNLFPTPTGTIAKQSWSYWYNENIAFVSSLLQRRDIANTIFTGINLHNCSYSGRFFLFSRFPQKLNVELCLDLNAFFCYHYFFHLEFQSSYSNLFLASISSLAWILEINITISIGNQPLYSYENAKCFLTDPNDRRWWNLCSSLG